MNFIKKITYLLVFGMLLVGCSDDDDKTFNLSPVFQEIIGSGTITTGESRTLLADATDADGDLILLSWTVMHDGQFISADNVLDKLIGRTVTFRATLQGSYNVLITARDGQGGKTEADAIVITVIKERQAPQFREPKIEVSPNRTIPIGEKAILKANAFHPDGEAFSYTWRAFKSDNVGQQQVLIPVNFLLSDTLGETVEFSAGDRGVYDIFVEIADEMDGKNEAQTSVTVIVADIPKIISADPPRDAVNVDPRNQRGIVIAFSRPMNVNKLKVDISPRISGIRNPFWSQNNTEMIIELFKQEGLAFNTEYTVTISNAEDIAGNKLEGTGQDLIIFRTTSVPDPPQIVSSNPPNNSDNIDPQNQWLITVNFTKSMNIRKLKVKIAHQAGEILDSVDAQPFWNEDNTTLIIDSKGLTFDTMYQIRISNAEDIAGNKLDGTGETTITFRTKLE